MKYNFAPNVLIPVFFSKLESDEVFSGKQVIFHCYSLKPYKKGDDDKIYNMFSEYASAIGFRVTDFEKWEKKYTKKYESPVPGIQIQGEDILLFGMRIRF